MAITDNRSTLGRNGFGAVMGSKRLKAIVVRGTKGVKIKDPSRFMSVVNKIRDAISSFPYLKLHHKLGIHCYFEEVWKNCMNPGKWTKSEWSKLYGVKKCREALRDNLPCTSCMLSCRASFEARDGEFAGQEVQFAHFLTLANVGQILNIKDWRKLVKILDLYNRAGMDQVSACRITSLLTSLYKDGIITKKDTNGLALPSNLYTYFNLAHKINHREGLGNTLAEGWFSISNFLGKNVHEFVAQVKGAAGQYDPRIVKLDPRIFSMFVNPRGALHAQGHWLTSIPMTQPEHLRRGAELMAVPKDSLDNIFKGEVFNVARLTRHVQDSVVVMDSLGVCVFYHIYGFLNIMNLAELYSAATGIELTPEELKAAGERSYNMLKVINVREGFTRKDDVFPEQWYKPKETADGVELLMDYYRKKPLTRDDIQELLNDYYDERGWDQKTGIPTKEKLLELELTLPIEDGWFV